MSAAAFDPWTQVTTRHGYAADEVISALQKSIRRGDVETAVRFAYEMYCTSPQMEEVLWDRLQVISVEDVGFGALEAPVLIDALNRMRKGLPHGATDRPLFFFHGIRYLCSRPKTRASDLLKCVVEEEFRQGIYPQLPDIALDMHTKRGREMGRGTAHFYNEASRVALPAQVSEPDYLSQLKKLKELD